MSYQCPVCGYNKLSRPPTDYHICPCCGTEFEADDFETTYEQLRQRWLNNGAVWFSEFIPKPANWNLYTQLANLESDVYSETVTVTRTHIDDSNKVINNPTMDVYFRGYWQIITYTGGTRTVGA